MRSFHALPDTPHELSATLPCLILLLCARFAPMVAATLPEGNTGIASHYAGDAGIASDSSVVFAEGFEEATVPALTARWEQCQHTETFSFSTDVPATSAGGKSLLITQPGGSAWGGDLYRRLLPGYTQIFVRYYVKFEQNSFQIHHGPMWVGGLNPATSWPNPNAGVRPAGDERFSTGSEPMGTAWRWDFYAYWTGMRGNPGGPQFWGNDFVNDATWTAWRGTWICVEQMVTLNDPVTESNGEQALWVDGKLRRKDGQIISYLGKGFPKGKWVWDSFTPDTSGTPFEGYQWRTNAALTINYLWPQVYITDAPAGQASRVWFDDIVVATRYVGPLQPSSSVMARPCRDESRGPAIKREGPRIVLAAGPAARGGSIALFSSSGRTAFACPQWNGAGFFSIRGMQPGVYIARLRDGDGTLPQRIVIEGN